MKKRLNLLLFTGIFPPDMGGPATYVRRLAEELAQRGHCVKVAAYGRGNGGHHPFPVVWLDGGGIVSRAWRGIIYLLKNAKKFDLIYTHGGPFDTGLPCFLMKWFLRVPVVTKVTGDVAWEIARRKGWTDDSIDLFQEKKYGEWRIRFFRWLDRKVVLSARYVVVPSFYLKKMVAGWGVDEKKIKVIYNSPETFSEISETKEALRDKLGLRGDILLSIGRLTPWKGFPALIGLMPRLLKANPNFTLVIVGSGPDEQKIKKQIESLNLGDRVLFRRKVSHQRIGEYLKAADMFVLNTGYEGLPHLVLEAFYWGVPVVTTTSGGNTEVVEDGRNGLLVGFNDTEGFFKAIIKVWQDNNLAQRLSAQARKDLDKFSFQKMYSQTERFLSSAAAQ